MLIMQEAGWIVGYVNGEGDVEVVSVHRLLTSANVMMACRGGAPWRRFRVDEESAAALLHAGVDEVHANDVIPNVWEVL